MTRVGLRERKRIDTRTRIMESACALFGERGIDQVTVEEIAAAADVGKGTVYNYFSAKEDIVIAYLIALDGEALEAMARLPGDRMSAGEALDAAAWSLLERKPPHREFVRAFLARIFAPDAFVHDLVEFQARLDSALTGMFERLLTRRGMRRTVGIPDLILSFKTMNLGITAVWTLEGPPFAAARALTRRHMSLLAKEMEL